MRRSLLLVVMLVAARLPAAGQAARDTVPPPRAEGTALRSLLGGSSDLWVRLLGRGELGGNWSRYRPCLNALQDACNPSVLPRLTPDLRFSVQLGGTIAQ